MNLLPAYAIDYAARLQGRKPALVRRMGRLQEGLKVLEFFANRQWSWANDNVAQLSEELNPTGGTSSQALQCGMTGFYTGQRNNIKAIAVCSIHHVSSVKSRTWDGLTRIFLFNRLVQPLCPFCLTLIRIG